MSGMSGFNVMHPYAWFATAGDPQGDVSHGAAAPVATDGNFFHDPTQASGSANPSGTASLAPAGMMARHAMGVYAGYAAAALQNPLSQAPLQGGPAVMSGPSQGPWAASDYAAAIPSNYISAAPPWKNGPMQHAAARMSPNAQVAIHATGQNPPISPALATTTAAAGSCPGGCGGGCGGHGRRTTFCRGGMKGQPATGLDSTNDFPPLYSQYQATANQTVNAALYQGVSTYTPAWTVAQGAAGDMEQPLQGA